MEIRRSLDERIVTVEGGSNAYGRVLFADAFAPGGGDLLLALEGFHSDGPWTRGDDFDGGKAALRYSRGDAQRGFSLTFLGYDATWLSTDQIPKRLVESGALPLALPDFRMSYMPQVEAALRRRYELVATDGDVPARSVSLLRPR